jgi:beta-glucanase (GH16 family)
MVAIVFLVVAALSVSALRTENLILDEEFNTFNFSLWKHELTLGGGGNWEFEMYWNNRTTSWVDDGILHIAPNLTAHYIGFDNVKNGFTMDIWGSEPANLCTGNAFYGCSRTSGAGGNYLNPVTSARLRTAEAFSFRYGRVEVRAKMPIGDWLWPAIWMLPKNNEYGNWPASGEIDIAESRGNIGYPKQYGGGPESFGSTLHWGPDYSQDPFAKTHKVYSLPTGTLNDDFHTYGLYWDENQIYTYIDDDSTRVLEVNTTDFWNLGEFPDSYFNPWTYSENDNAPFDKEFYIVLNVAVGGTSGYFPDNVGAKLW